MENKEIKNTTAKLGDDLMEDVNGGLWKPIILNVEDGMTGRNLELNEDALKAVTGGSVSSDPVPKSEPPLIQCPKCGRWFEYGSSCMHGQDSVFKYVILCSKCGRSFESGSSCPHCRV